MPSFTHQKPRYTLKEALKLLGFGRAKFYELLNDGLIESIKDGGRRYISAEAIDQYLSSRT